MIVKVLIVTINDEMLDKQYVYQVYQLNDIFENHKVKIKYFLS
jgi:hypothetical protein